MLDSIACYCVGSQNSWYHCICFALSFVLCCFVFGAAGIEKPLPTRNNFLWSAFDVSLMDRIEHELVWSLGPIIDGRGTWFFGCSFCGSAVCWGVLGRSAGSWAMTEFRNKIEIRICAIAAMRGDTFKSRSGHQELLTRKPRKSSSRSRRLYNSVLVSIQIKNLLKPENTETKNS